MGIFGKVKELTNEQKEAHEKRAVEKTASLIDKYGLNLSEYSMQDIKDANSKNIKAAHRELSSMSGIKLLAALKMSTAEQATTAYLKALTEQNWIMIRQNEVMIRLLAKEGK